MKRFFVAASLALGLCVSLPAQQTYQPLIEPLVVSAALPSAPSVAAQSTFAFVPELVLPAAQPAFPAPATAPQFGGANGDFYKFALGVGYEFVHFKSAPFSANLSGLHTDLSYNFTDWLGVEGNVVSAWGTKVFNSETSKYALYTGGVRIGWGISARRLTPWAHALVGGVHVNPQTAAGGKNAFATQLGGGADYRLNERLSVRAEGDYVRTQLYSSSQNNFQFNAGIVIHF